MFGSTQVRKLEFYNEPDLTANAKCVGNAAGANATMWLEYYIVQANAIANAFADLNSDVASGAISCPAGAFLPCPLQPIIHASAFADGTFSGIKSGAGTNLQVITP